MTVVDVPAVRVAADVHYELSDFLFHEADLLDGWQFREWLTLFAPEAKYWAPVRENRTWRERGKEMSPRGGSAYFDEDLPGLRQRIDRLHTHMAWAEEPPSRTRHLITNVRAWETDLPGEYAVNSSFYVYRTRSERDQDVTVGRRFDTIRATPENEPKFRIVSRKIVFDVSTLLVKNLSCFY